MTIIITFSLLIIMREWGYFSLYSDQATGWTTGVEFLAGALKGFFSLHLVQTGSGAHPASYPVGTRDSFLGGKAPGA
jgi:hypothetical protein